MMRITLTLFLYLILVTNVTAQKEANVWYFGYGVGLSFNNSQLTPLSPLPVPKPYNVLFIAVDDLNNELGCYGSKGVQSPNIDALARRGVRFERAYCQFPLCSPSRVSLLTGLRSDTTRIQDLKAHFRTTIPTVTTLPQLFKNSGYFTARIGKLFHYGVPRDIGTSGLDDSLSWHLVRNPKGRDKWDEEKITNLSPDRSLGSALAFLAAEGTDEEQTDGMIADEAVRLLKEHKEGPFFLAVGFFRPHCPFVAPKKYFDQYPPEKIKLPQEPADDLSDIPEPAFYRQKPYWGLTEAEQQQSIAAYYASITFMDAQVGKVLRALDELKLRDNTIVVLWSDHGYLLTQHKQWMKEMLFDPSLRVPLIIAAPRARGNGQASPRTVELIDLYPTLAQLTSLKAPSYLHGKSLVPLLENPQVAWNRPAYSQQLRVPANIMGRSVRTERWRYTEWGGANGIELYDHQHDPEGYTNLARNPAYANTVTEMKTLLRKGIKQ